MRWVVLDTSDYNYSTTQGRYNNVGNNVLLDSEI